MSRQIIMILIAIAVLTFLLFAVSRGEGFQDMPYYTNSAVLTAASDALNTCAPADGVWSVPNADEQGRSRLASPCCQPPNYRLASNYKTCSDQLNPNNPIESCIATCCKNADNEARNYDSSWYPMAKCACSLWCYNKDVPHFKKYGTAVHYITGDIAEAQTNDSGDFIGGTGYDFSGQ